ncbi:hypothetical protein Tco_1072546 [Tanacetum coccineum]
MINELSIVDIDKEIHTVETNMVKLVVEIKCFGKSFDEFDKETWSSDWLQPKRKSVQKLSVHLKVFQFHIVDVHVIE